MKPIPFKEADVTYAKDQPQYGDLPAFKYPNKEGMVVTCWELSFRERLRLLFGGKLWLTLMTFHMPLQPVFLTTKKEQVIDEETSKLILEQREIDKLDEENRNI